MKKYIGMDIGGTKCAVTIGEADEHELRLLGRREFATRQYAAFPAALEQLTLCAQQLCAGHGLSTEEIAGVGVSCGGPLDSKRGLILSPPNLIGWDRVPIVEKLREHFHVNVHLQNDANACALAEWRYGAGKGVQNMIFITFGTGCGAGLILNGALYSGTNDMAGECGHMRLNAFGPVGYGKQGSMEGFCSGGGIAQLGRSFALERLQAGKPAAYCRSLAEMDGITAKTIAQAAREGDETASRLFETVGAKLGEGLALMMDLLNPDAIVIGGIYARCEDLLWPGVKPVIARETLPLTHEACRVLPAMLGESIGDYAAMAVACEGTAF